MVGYDHDNIRALLALLDSGRFETLCHELLGAEGHTERHHRGAGGGDRGIDVLSTAPDGRRWATQCKHSRTGAPAKGALLKDLKSTLGDLPDPPPAVYLVATNTALTSATVEELEGLIAAAAFPLELALWDGTEIVSLLIKHEAVRRQFLPTTSLPGRRHGILEPARDFTGRESELAKLLAAVDAKPGAVIAGLQGMGGIGKTELARRIAQERWDNYPDAHLEVELLGASSSPLSSADAFTQLIRDLEPQAQLPEDESTLVRIFQGMMRGQRGILLLDNAASAEQVQSLLPPSGWLTLVTSRFHFVVPGLKVLDLGPMPENEARSFLAELSPRAADVADDLLRLTGRLPPALRLAGSALAIRIDLSPADYVQRLEKVRGLVDGVARTLAVSFDLFDADQQARWSMLSVFPGSFTAAAVGAVWEVKEDEAKDALFDFIASSMVSLAEGRYRLHDLARVFAREHFIESDAIHYRHAAFYVAALGGFDARYKAGNDGVLEGLRGFDLEGRNIEAARAWLCEPGRDPDARRLLVQSTTNVAYILDLRLHRSEWIGWQEEALRVARSLENRTAEGRLLGNIGTGYGALGDARKSIEHYEQSLAIAREIGDRHGEGQLLGNIGTGYGALGDARKSIEHYEQSLAIAREIGDRRSEGAVLGNLGSAYRDLGDARTAIEHYELQIAIAREIGDRQGEANSSWNMAHQLEKQGDLTRAIDLAQVCVDFEREIGHPDAEKHAARVEGWRARLLSDG